MTTSAGQVIGERQQRAEHVAATFQYRFRQLTRVDYHVFSYDPPGETVLDWSVSRSANGHFEVDANSNTTAACLNCPLYYILQPGAERIRARRQPLLRRHCGSFSPKSEFVC